LISTALNLGTAIHFAMRQGVLELACLLGAVPIFAQRFSDTCLGGFV
jgi:hypothetical protein